MAAPDTSSYVLVTPDTGDLPNSVTLAAAGGLKRDNTGPGKFVTITTTGNLANLNAFNMGGFVNYNIASQQFVPITFTEGPGISITNRDGQLGDTSFSVIANSSVQRVIVQNDGVVITPFGQPGLNFKAGANTSVSISENIGNGTADITYSLATSSAPETATYITKHDETGTLPNSQPLSPLSTGLMKVTTGTGVISTAVENTDYQAPSAHLTSLAAITPDLGTMIVGNGVGYSGVSISPVAGSVWTSNGTNAGWSTGPEGFNVVVLPTSTTAVIMENKTSYVPTSTTGTVIFTLPLGVPGQVYEITGFGSSGWRINQLPAQTINFGSVSTTSGMTGSLSSTTRWDAIRITCITATEFIATNPFGNLTAA